MRVTQRRCRVASCCWAEAARGGCFCTACQARRCFSKRCRPPHTLTRVPPTHLDVQKTHRDYAPMPHLDQFALSELASESEPLGDFSEEQGARLSAEREMAERDRREGRLLGRGVRRPGALLADDDGACACLLSRQRGLGNVWPVLRARPPLTRPLATPRRPAAPSPAATTHGGPHGHRGAGG